MSWEWGLGWVRVWGGDRPGGWRRKRAGGGRRGTAKPPPARPRHQPLPRSPKPKRGPSRRPPNGLELNFGSSVATISDTVPHPPPPHTHTAHPPPPHQPPPDGVESEFLEQGGHHQRNRHLRKARTEAHARAGAEGQELEAVEAGLGFRGEAGRVEGEGGPPERGGAAEGERGHEDNVAFGGLDGGVGVGVGGGIGGWWWTGLALWCCPGSEAAHPDRTSSVKRAPASRRPAHPC
jgi:hypothetical protein